LAQRSNLCKGSIFGPSLGGSLVYPTKRFPDIFGGVKFLEKYPFALPNLLISSLFLTGIVFGILFFRETLEDKKDSKDYGLIAGSLLTTSCTGRKYPAWHQRNTDEQAEAFLSSGNTSNPSSPVLDRQPKRAGQTSDWALVFTYQSKLNLAVYTFLAMHSVSFDQLLPVFLDFSPVQTIDDPKVKLPLRFSGGFDLNSGRIGAIFTVYGICGMVIQFFIFPPVVRRFGALKCFKAVAIMFPVIYLAIPYVSLFRTNAQRQGVLMALMLIKGFCAIFSFPCSTILLTNSAASLKVLGTLNGVATSISALGRAAGPALAGAAFTLGADIGYMVLPWWTLAFIAVIGAIPAWWLVEMDGFGGGNSTKDEFDADTDSEEDNNGLADEAVNRIVAARESVPIDLAVNPANEPNLLSEPLSRLVRTDSRGSTGRTRSRSRRESFGLQRMRSPVGMGSHH